MNHLKCRRNRFNPCVRKTLGEENGNPLQYSCLGIPMDRGTWWATVHGVPKESDMTWQLNNNKTLIYTTNSTRQHFISNFAHPTGSLPPPLHFPSVTIHLTSFPLSPFLLRLPGLSTCSFFLFGLFIYFVFSCICLLVFF